MWRLRDETFFDAVVLCVQETRMLKHEAEAFSKTCRAQGFAAYWQEGLPTVGGGARREHAASYFALSANTSNTTFLTL